MMSLKTDAALLSLMSIGLVIHVSQQEMFVATMICMACILVFHWILDTGWSH